MSWFKKLFQKFNSEEEEYIDELPPQKHEGNRDVGAKVLYQYPKGQFRFPLIPDEDKGERRTRDVERKVADKSFANSTGSRRSSINKKVETTSRLERVADTRAGHVEKKKNTSNRPFRPTEIPSPIYGYDRRHPQKTEPVEFELGNFSRKDSNQDTNLEQRIEEQSLEDLYELELEKQIPEPLDELEIEEQSPEDLYELELEEQNPEPLYELELEEQIPEPLYELEIEEQLPRPLFELEIKEQPIEPVQVQEQVTDELEQLVKLPTEQELYEEHIQEKPEEQHEIESNAEAKYSDEQEEIQPNVVDVAAQLESEHSTEWKSETEDEEPKKRSHIPFNVIMLKEDKRKLQERILAESELMKPLLETSPAVEKLVKKEEEVSSIPSFQSFSNDNEEEIEDEPYYVYPSLELLKPPVFKSADMDWLQLQEEQLNETLFNFNVRASVANVTQGPSVTRFEVRPEPGVKVNKITNLADDIKLSLAAKDIRMEAPIPGTHMIGIEVPNETSRPVFISEILTSEAFSISPSPLTAVLGLDISGKPIVTDLRKMPHGLIAGATGSGKSVCINSILVSLLYKANPNEVKLLLIDPKMVELAPYNQIPHLVSPVITDVKAATAALKWAVDEMERRYELFAHAGVRDISRFNEIAEQEKNYSVKLPYIVIVIDELADLMMMSPADVEEAICRIAQKARACGIHLIIATQRPSVDVITGLIKANVPTRIAFSVSSQIDSRTIIDISGAERLLGRGDMLFLENGSSKPVRLQGTFVSDEEIDAIVAHVRREQSPQYLFEQEELLKKAVVSEEEDELFYEACEFVIEQGGASTSSLQRKFKIGYNRAARLIDVMEEQGFISEAKGSKPRDVLITETELESIQDT